LHADDISDIYKNDPTQFTVFGTTIYWTSDHELLIALTKRITKKIIANADERAAAMGTKRR